MRTVNNGHETLIEHSMWSCKAMSWITENMSCPQSAVKIDLSTKIRINFNLHSVLPLCICSPMVVTDDLYLGSGKR